MGGLELGDHGDAHNKRSSWTSSKLPGATFVTEEGPRSELAEGPVAATEEAGVGGGKIGRGRGAGSTADGRRKIVKTPSKIPTATVPMMIGPRRERRFRRRTSRFVGGTFVGVGGVVSVGAGVGVGAAGAAGAGVGAADAGVGVVAADAGFAGAGFTGAAFAIAGFAGAGFVGAGFVGAGLDRSDTIGPTDGTELSELTTPSAAKPNGRTWVFGFPSLVGGRKTVDST